MYGPIPCKFALAASTTKGLGQVIISASWEGTRKGMEVQKSPQSFLATRLRVCRRWCLYGRYSHNQQDQHVAVDGPGCRMLGVLVKLMMGDGI